MIFWSQLALVCENETNTDIQIEGVFVSEILIKENKNKEDIIWFVIPSSPFCIKSIGSISKIELDISERSAVNYLMVPNKKYIFIGKTVLVNNNKKSYI